MRRKKRGFAVNVVDEWFEATATGMFHDFLTDTDAQMYRFLKPAAVRKLLKSHRSGRQDNHKLLFSLVVLEQWLRGMRSAQEQLIIR
jgi:asparagine synthase (glutamine-hydrolysing)